MKHLSSPLPVSTKLACVMVGLPARGKTYIARKIARYLTWLGHRSKIFNVGNYRRDALGAVQPNEFFDPCNVEASKRRTEVALLALDDMISWIETAHNDDEQGSLNNIPDFTDRGATKSPILTPSGPSGAGPTCVALYDATNSTQDRRKEIIERCRDHGISVMFVESICDDPEVVMANIREVKVSSPDYVGVEPEKAIKDFILRIQHYERSYEPLSENEADNTISFVKLINVGKQVIVQNVRGYIQSRIVYFLMNLNITPRHFYFCRHGESLFNVQGRIGGDANLSPRGEMFAKKLPLSIANHVKQDRLTIWTSTLKRTIQTGSLFDGKVVQLRWKQLDELDSGSCEGLTYEEIAEKFPDDYAERDQDKYNYRYHGGESYADLVQRLEPVIMELERHHEPNHSILIIGHQAVLRAIYAYFLNVPHEELPYIKVPLHTIVKLTPRAYGCIEERFAVDVPAVDTHRERPKSAGNTFKKPVQNWTSLDALHM